MKKSRLKEIIKEEVNRLFNPDTHNDLNLIKSINDVEKLLRIKGIPYNEYSKSINHITLGDDLGYWMDGASEESLEEVLKVLRGLLSKRSTKTHLKEFFGSSSRDAKKKAAHRRFNNDPKTKYNELLIYYQSRILNIPRHKRVYGSVARHEKFGPEIFSNLGLEFTPNFKEASSMLDDLIGTNMSYGNWVKFYLNNSSPIEENLLNEKYQDKFKLSGKLVTNTKSRPQQEILSDIRSIAGVTIVSTNELGDSSAASPQFNSILNLKIDGYPYISQGGFSRDTIPKIIDLIKKVPDVMSFNYNPNEISPI